MFNKTRHKFHQLQSESENARIKSAISISFILGIIIILFCLTVLLPLQIYFNNSSSQESSVASETIYPQVGGISDMIPAAVNP